MSKYCLVGTLAEQFKAKLKSGEINPEKLAKMTSQERNKYFSTFLGEENAKNVNALFERNLLAKNRWNAMIKWAKETTGIKPEVRRDLISKIEKMVKDKNGNLLNPAEEKAFLQDLASTKIGVDVTANEAKKISELSNIITEKKTLMEKDVNNEKNRIDYGNSLLDMYDYVASLKPGMKTTEQIANVANLPRAAMSTLDFSAPFRQGFGMISNKRFWQNLAPMFKAAFSEKAYRNIRADIISMPTYQTMKKGGLRITGLGDKLSEREEAFMTNLLDKIPGVRGSERAYTAFLTKLRADAFNDLLQKAALAGEDIKPGSKATKDLANVVNNFTGAGKLISGAVDTASPIANAFFFSPRKIAATIQKFNPNNILNPNISKTARIAHLKNLVGMAGVSATILSLAKLGGAEVEPDPRSSDFGKVKIGNTRIDVTGGDANYLTLVARLVTGETKSTTSDIVRTLGEDYGAATRGDTLVKYFRNKLSPTASFIGDWLYGTDAIGKPFNIKDEIKSRVMPMIINTGIEAYQDKDASTLLNVGADMFGFGTSVYNNNVDWKTSSGKELKQFKDKISPENFQKANDEYNQKVNEKVVKILENDRYKKLSDDDKLKVITKLKTGVKNEVFKKYKFTYKQETVKKNKTIDVLAK